VVDLSLIWNGMPDTAARDGMLWSSMKNASYS